MGIHAEVRHFLWNREQIESEIERLIEMLDAYDGDCDLEDDDPAGGNIEDERQDPGHYLTIPTYAVDQSHGLTNSTQIVRNYHRQMRGEG